MRAANAFAKAYMETVLDLRVGPTKQAAVWFDDQLKTLRKELEDAQTKLAAFQREKGIIVTDERMDIEITRLNELSAQSLRAADVTYESQSRSGLASGSRSRENLPEVLGNPVISRSRETSCAPKPRSRKPRPASAPTTRNTSSRPRRSRRCARRWVRRCRASWPASRT
jgi:uncharacterized protein involved in exopolysaccharide biosynthesis